MGEMVIYRVNNHRSEYDQRFFLKTGEIEDKEGRTKIIGRVSVPLANGGFDNREIEVFVIDLEIFSEYIIGE